MTLSSYFEDTTLVFGLLNVLAAAAILPLCAGWAQKAEPLSFSRIFPVEVIVDSGDPALKQEIFAGLTAKIQSINGAYIATSNPGWRIRVQALSLPRVDGFGVPVVDSIVVLMVSPDNPAPAKGPEPTNLVSRKGRGNETIVFHYQLMRERADAQEFADAIGGHLEQQVWAAFRRGTRDVLSTGPAGGTAPKGASPKASTRGTGNTIPAKDYFTLGSTVNEVLRIQGTPTSIIGSSFSGQVYMWGLSSVTFVDGKVSEYSNAGGNLRVRLPVLK